MLKVLKNFTFIFIIIWSCVLAQDSSTLAHRLGNKMDTVDGISKLVSDYFKTLTNKRNGSTTNRIFMGFLKLLGFDTTKIVAIAVNGLIFLAQLLGTSLMHKPTHKMPESRHDDDISSENPFDWLLENSEIARIISHVTDPNLDEHVIEYVKERSANEESACLQLLICKIAPFVWGMQKALNTTNGTNGTIETSVFYRYVPGRDEIWEQSRKCQEQYHFCNR